MDFILKREFKVTIELDNDLSNCIEAIQLINQKPNDVKLLKQELRCDFDEDLIKIAKMLIKKDLLK